MSTDVHGSRSLSDQVAEEIRVMLVRRRMSGRELARRLDVSPGWVSYRLSGTQQIDLNDLARIAPILGVSVVDLLPKTEGGQRTRQYLPGERVIATVGADTTKPAIPQQRSRQHRRPSVGDSIRPLSPVGR